MHIEDIDTPALILDLDVMERNIKRLQAYLKSHGIKNRPHVKTHKIPAIAHMQLEAGAVGIACQKLGEVEVMADAGIKDILLTYNIIGKQKLERLVRVAKRTNLVTTVDNLVAAEAISNAAQDAGIVISVVAELGTELQRTGVPAPNELVNLAKEIDDLQGLRLRGLLVFPSGRNNKDHIAEAVEGFHAAGLSTEIVSGGGTPTAFEAHHIPEVTEHRAGTYVYNDTMMIDAGAATLDDCALTVLATAVSRPTPNRAIIDAGTKTFSSDAGLPMGFVVDYPEAQIYDMNEEHGYVAVSGCIRPPEIGDRLRVIPNHACGATNMHDQVYGVRGAEVDVIWDIQARGKVR